jgi:hypothetical protein
LVAFRLTHLFLPIKQSIHTFIRGVISPKCYSAGSNF